MAIELNTTYSWGTQRSEDLVSCFLGILKENDKKAFDKAMAEVPAEAWDDENKLFANEDHAFWDSEDAVELVEYLFDMLNNLAPEGYYFGNLEGDGSDYGFWQCEEEDY